ncbi:CAP domain-containing protein [Kitasatospora sp. A2-31]|uniref:CAP domain-containing protein n=1 Tax=Kitasatospora sp. A2-31 TaxID=2916414 RepID=UPI001EEB01E6|nr:CAP domain-containing protein [Kitasatospora sp. A2-31]MCG6493838.1 CAP domain-containing protein [Kitasatospora sp. A2-31]
MNSEDRTTILPASGRGAADGGRVASRAADRRAGRGRRGRRRGGVGPVVAVVAAVAGTGVVAALAGAGFGVYTGATGDRDERAAVVFEPQIAAEAGDHDGIQVPGAGGGDPTMAGGPSGAPGGTDEAHAATADPASPGATATATGSPTATTSTKASATPSATGPTASASGKASTAPRTSATTTTAGRTTQAAPPAGSAGGGSGGGGASGDYAQQVVDLVNAERAKAGCGPVTAESRLATAAQNHSEDMANRNYFDHASPEGYHADHRIEATGYRWSSWGENIARGQKDPAAVMNAWMNSSGHRANILNCSFKQIGVGVRTGSGGPWWTQVFAVPA